GDGQPAAIASDGAGYVVVLRTQDPVGNTALTAVRLDGNGTVLDRIAVVTSRNYLFDVGVAWNGDFYLVSWFVSEVKEIRAAVVRPGGPAPRSFRIAGLRDEYPRSVSLASAGGSFLLVWEDLPGGKYVGPVVASVISSRGRV